VTKNASDVTVQAPPNVTVLPVVVQKPEPAAEPAPQTAAEPAPQTAAAAPAVAQPQAPLDIQPPAATSLPPAPPSRAAATEAPASPLQFVFLAIALIGLAGGAVVYVAEIRRRRSDVLNSLPLDISPPQRRVRTIIDAPSSPPLSPRDPGESGRENDEALVMRPRQRRAA
jgi:hypothetical protein